MARIWHEGFEDGFPCPKYLEGNPVSQNIKDMYFTEFPNHTSLSSGRNAYSSKSLRFYRQESQVTLKTSFTKYLPNMNVLYFRTYLKWTQVTTYYGRDIIRFRNNTTIIASIYQSDNAGTFDFYVRDNSVYESKCSFLLSENTWYKLEAYLNITTGDYEFRVDNVPKVQDNGDLGALPVNNILSGSVGSGTTAYGSTDYYLDDIALNDNSGSINNSWCGDGTIISLKPKGAGNYSQWDVCEGYAKAESGTNTTNIKVTAHGLNTNDVIYNKTRNAYRIITKVDADNYTVTSVTGQTTDDIILQYVNVATIAATSGTSTSLAVIPGHTMKPGDVIVNTTRSNAIREVIYVNGNSVYNSYTTSTNSNGTLGSTITSQASGDSIKTFAFTPYAISNHWEAVANQTDPSPKQSYVQTDTLNDIDTYDMEELVADKVLPSVASVVAVSHNIYAKEAGAGSTIKPIFRIGGTDYAGDTIPLSGGTLQYQTMYDTSPDTSSQWTVSEIDGLEAGVKLV